jgi:hypothetical protein
MQVKRENESEILRRSLLATAGISLMLVAAGCDDDDEDDDDDLAAVDDAYTYGYYYPADVAASDVAWSDDFDDDFLFQAPTNPDAGSGNERAAEPGAVLRALARGVGLCPNQVTITPRMTNTPCVSPGTAGMIRTGATLTFNACTLAGGGRIDGSVDVQSTHTADGCSADTVINVTYTSTLTNLAYTAPGGAKVVIPSQTNIGSYSRPLGGRPSALSVQTSGALQRFDAAGARIADHTYSGNWSYKFSAPGATASYTVDGPLTVQPASGGGPVTATAVGVTRTAACCRPSAGTIAVAGAGRSTSTWVFGPSCGAVTVNGAVTTLPACP